MYEIFQVFIREEKIGGSWFYSRITSPTGRIYSTKEEAEKHIPKPTKGTTSYQYFIAPQGTTIYD